MKKIFLEFLNIYFWIFIIIFIMDCIYVKSDEFKINKKNAIKYGNYKPELFNFSIAITLFILSIILT